MRRDTAMAARGTRRISRASPSGTALKFGGETRLVRDRERYTMVSDASPRCCLHRLVKKGAAFALAAALALSGLPGIVNAQVSKKLSVGSLEGSWSGVGTVSFAS